jgi:hypothetical protein
MKRYNLTFSKFGRLVEDLNGEWFRYADSEDMNAIITEIADSRLSIIQERNLELETIKHNVNWLNELLIKSESENLTLKDQIRQIEFDKQMEINTLTDTIEDQQKSLKCVKIINTLLLIVFALVNAIKIFPTIGF